MFKIKVSTDIVNIMARPVKKLENRLCKLCDKTLHFKLYRKVYRLKKGKRKGQVLGWTASDNSKRFSVCNECEKARFYARYRQNPIPQLIYNFKKRAKAKNVPFDLKPQDIKEKLNNAGKIWPVLVIKMQISKLGSKSNDLAPSIDRIDPKKGYVKGNMIVVSMRANRIKTDASPEEIKKVAYFYDKLLKNG